MHLLDSVSQLLQDTAKLSLIATILLSSKRSNLRRRSTNKDLQLPLLGRGNIFLDSVRVDETGGTY
jgi:hypothetical protein